MAKFGSVILKYRRLNNLTQGQLAEKLYVSPQAVSKWEKDQSEPDLATIKKLADIFEISVDQFFLEEKETAQDEVELEEIVESTQAICSICLKEIADDNIHAHNPALICKDCHNELLEEEGFFEDFSKNKPKSITIGKLKGKIPFIIGAGIGIGIFLLYLGLGIFSDDITFIDGLTTGIVLGVLSITFITQVLYDSWLRDFFTGFMGYTMRMPGLIFELSIDGIIWVIIVKFIFGIITFLITVAVFLLGLGLSIAISPFTYVYELVIRIKGGFHNEY